MRGSPFLQAICMIAAFLVAAVPVYRLTRPASASAAEVSGRTEVPDATAAAVPVPLEVAVEFAPSPEDFQLKNLDQTVLAGRGPQARFQARWNTAVPPEGVDLVIRAHWPALAAGAGPAGPAAARVTLRFPDGHQAEKSFWAAGDGTLTEVFTVPGTPVAAAP